ncbi:MAG: GTPase domain-containing protein [Deltaproteobacteria bacterium]|nr:GTPase domain-containing protein [Deltaproteobacteria bacterium]
MGELDREAKAIKAKIVYFGPSGVGLTTNLESIARKLKKEQCGDLRVSRVPKDKKAAYEVLPVDLGKVRGYRTAMQIYTVPGGTKHAAIRRRILEGADGVVFVADLRPDRHDVTLAAVKELEGHLKVYGRTLEDTSLIVQYNRRDEVDESVLDRLHRRLALKPAAFFEASANDGTGVLQTLTTLSKVILAEFRRRAEGEPVSPRPAAQAQLDGPNKGFRIESAGPAQGSDGAVQIPIRLIDEASGRRLEFSLQLIIGETK